MSLTINASGAAELAPGLWSFEMAPHQVRLLGSTNHSFGEESVILLPDGRFNPTTSELQFALDSATPINVGTTSRVIGLDVKLRAQRAGGAEQSPSPSQSNLGPGDREFLQLAEKELSPKTVKAARALLQGVRAKSAGNLQRGQSRNFSETPDNFWYVIVQPRVDELSVTVRGSTDHFAAIARLEIKDDRGNTRFKVGSEADVPNALELIFHARRKR